MKKISIALLGILFLTLTITGIYSYFGTKPPPASPSQEPYHSWKRIPSNTKTPRPPEEKKAPLQTKPRPNQSITQEPKGRQNLKPTSTHWKKNLNPKERYGLFEPSDELDIFRVEKQHYFVSKLYSALLKTKHKEENAHVTIGRYIIVDKDQQGLPVVYHPNTKQAGIVTGNIDINVKQDTDIESVVAFLSQHKDLYKIHAVVPRLKLIHLKVHPDQDPLTIQNQIRSLSEISEIHSEIYWGGVRPQ